MPRPFCKRIVESSPGASYFKPAGIPMRMLEEASLTLDEFESLRLADLEGMYQEEAAKKMGVSRPTFSRIVASARKKIADALVNGKALRIEGGHVHGFAAPQEDISAGTDGGRGHGHGRGRWGRAGQ
ncbi:MAG: DUF134 domain-containing protein [Victivallales bacterium]|nr:DUF134 domain-containing protein [Victivallales bacterium]